jgi:Tol biopolymer transport system component
VQEMTWSPDGRWLVLRTDNGVAGAGDLVGVRTSGDTTPVPLVASSFTELEPAVSPDSRWLAYASNESGANEIYVRPFPGTTGARWQVSTGGGAEPTVASCSFSTATPISWRPRCGLGPRSKPPGSGHSSTPPAM